MLKIFESFEFLGKCLLIRVRNLRPMFVETFWLYGGLNQVIFRRRFVRFLFSLLLFRSSRNSVISQKPLSARALSYIGLASPNAVSSLDISVRRRLMEAGKFLIKFSSLSAPTKIEELTAACCRLGQSGSPRSGKRTDSLVKVEDSHAVPVVAS